MSEAEDVLGHFESILYVCIEFGVPPSSVQGLFLA